MGARLAIASPWLAMASKWLALAVANGSQWPNMAGHGRLWLGLAASGRPMGWKRLAMASPWLAMDSQWLALAAAGGGWPMAKRCCPWLPVAGHGER